VCILLDIHDVCMPYAWHISCVVHMYCSGAGTSLCSPSASPTASTSSASKTYAWDVSGGTLNTWCSGYGVELKMCRFQRSRVRFLSRPSAKLPGLSRRQLVKARVEGFALSRKRTVRELIEPLTKKLANTYLLQPGNLDGDLSNRLL